MANNGASTRLLTTSPWRRITSAIRQASESAAVAVAYFGNDGSKLLPLRKGSVLVVDLSVAAVRAGVTKPDELLKLVEKGVRVYSRPGLHAKVFVTPTRVIIGSCNASARSAMYLEEAAIESTDKTLIRDARAFVTSMAGDAVGPAELKQLQAEYRAPRFLPVSRRRSSTTSADEPRRWVFRLAPAEWTEADDQEAREARPIARSRLSNSEHFVIDEFLWTGKLPLLSKGDTILQIFEISPRNVVVVPPGKLLLKKAYRGPRTTRTILFVERPKRLRARKLSAVLERLEPAGRFLRNAACRQVTNEQVWRSLQQLWLSVR